MMLNRVWQCRKGYNKGTRVEKHVWADGSEHYSYVDRFGRYLKVGPTEAQNIIRIENMEDVTESYKAAGWIDSMDEDKWKI